MFNFIKNSNIYSQISKFKLQQKFLKDQNVQINQIK